MLPERKIFFKVIDQRSRPQKVQTIKPRNTIEIKRFGVLPKNLKQMFLKAILRLFIYKALYD